MALHHAVGGDRYTQELHIGLREAQKRMKRLQALVDAGAILRDTMATPGWIMLRKECRELRKNFQRMAVSLDFSDPKILATQLRIRERELFFTDCAHKVKSAKTAPKEMERLATNIEAWQKALQGCEKI